MKKFKKPLGILLILSAAAEILDNPIYSIVSLLIGIILVFGDKIKIYRKIKELDYDLNHKEELYAKEYNIIKQKIEEEVKLENQELSEQIENKKNKITDLDEYINDKEQVKENIIKEALEQADKDIEKSFGERAQVLVEVRNLNEDKEELIKKISREENKLNKIREEYKGFKYALKYCKDIEGFDSYLIPEIKLNESELTVPSKLLKLHSYDYKELKKMFNQNQREIDKKLDEYNDRYTTKANKSIYQLMVLALRAELQNILYNLKYERLESAIDDIKIMTGKYLNIAAEGNQSIAPTLTKFIGEIEYLFINSVKIEYEYYLKKEKAREEQAALKEKMRIEAAEIKRLKEEQKKILEEESKYNNEIDKLKESLKNSVEENEINDLQKRIKELEGQLASISDKKEEILTLQNGKAGNVYIISNIGSFGENVFKIGMTRRIDPMERINELGSASVPFNFDVHSTIFSDDAVSLENSLHQALDENRVNLVNTRKEFFYATLDELEELVFKIDPTAEFNRTIVAEEYNQSKYLREKIS